MIAAGGCDKLSCNATGPEPAKSDPQSKLNWAQKSPLLASIPSTARAVVLGNTLADLSAAINFGADRLPVARLATIRKAWTTQTKLEAFSAEALGELGVDADAPTAVFYDRGFWTLAAQVAKADRLDKALDGMRKADQPGEAIEPTDFGSMSLLALGADGGLPVYLAHDDHTLLVAVRVEKTALNENLTGLPTAWLADSPKTRFFERDQHRQLLDRLPTYGNLVAVVRPAAWMAAQPAEGQAKKILSRMVDQIGPIGAAARTTKLDEAVDVRVLTPGNPRAPAMITDLGRAEGDVPPLGGLIEPGVIGVGRLSVSPRQLYSLLVSTMPARRRTELAGFWERLDKELRINAQRDVLDNLRGHAVVVAYGLDRDALEDSDLPWFLEILQLEATREAVLVPIKEREPMVQVLDALTTVSKGKLTRQAVGHTLQYAWMVDGELKWALIVSDEHVIYVDSAVAFEHAGAYERGARPLGERFEKMGLTDMLHQDHQAGVYVDAASLGDILTETGHQDAGRWLQPFRAAVVTTGMDADMGVTDVRLEIAAGSPAAK